MIRSVMVSKIGIFSSPLYWTLESDEILRDFLNFCRLILIFNIRQKKKLYKFQGVVIKGQTSDFFNIFTHENEFEFSMQNHLLNERTHECQSRRPILQNYEIEWIITRSSFTKSYFKLSIIFHCAISLVQFEGKRKTVTY